MKTNIFLVLVSTVFLTGIITLGCTTGEQEKQTAQAPSIVGTYRLVSGEFFDGTTSVSAEDVIGIMTFTETHKNLNSMAMDEKGRVSSVSSVATYTLTPTEYTETNICYIAQDEIRNLMTGYDFTKETGTSPVKFEKGRILFKFPLHDEPSLVFDGEKLTIEGPDFVLIWERVA